jgi:hypothetical protein
MGHESPARSQLGMRFKLTLEKRVYSRRWHKARATQGDDLVVFLSQMPRGRISRPGLRTATQPPMRTHARVHARVLANLLRSAGGELVAVN